MSEQAAWMHRFHSGGCTVRGSGVFDVCRGDRWPGRLVAALLRLPPTGESVPVHVEIVRTRNPVGGAGAGAGWGVGSARPGARWEERWIRHIGLRRLASVQTHDGDHVRERFGPVEFRMRLVREETQLWLRPEGAALCVGRRRLRLPHWCAPQASAFVRTRPGVQLGRAQFELRVRIRVPAAGLLLSYSGHIAEDTDG
jgi:hypothetical protein